MNRFKWRFNKRPALFKGCQTLTLSKLSESKKMLSHSNQMLFLNVLNSILLSTANKSTQVTKRAEKLKSTQNQWMHQKTWKITEIQKFTQVSKIFWTKHQPAIISSFNQKMYRMLHFSYCQQIIGEQCVHSQLFGHVNDVSIVDGKKNMRLKLWKTNRSRFRILLSEKSTKKNTHSYKNRLSELKIAWIEARRWWWWWWWCDGAVAIPVDGCHSHVNFNVMKQFEMLSTVSCGIISLR